MKALVLTLFLGLTLGLSAQDITPAVVKAIESGNAAALSQHLTPNVDLTIGDNEDMYPVDQATKKLAAFFAGHKPTSFEIKHKGTSKLDDQYRIGDLITSKGKYRVTFFIKKSDNGMKVKQLRIEDFDDDF
jgi:hypothetical protein